MPDTHNVITPDERFDFVAAERALAEFLADPANIRGDEGDGLYRLVDSINLARPRNFADLAIKLRVLADENIGVPVGASETDATSLKEILTFVEGLLNAITPSAREAALFIKTHLPGVTAESLENFADRLASSADQTDPSVTDPMIALIEEFQSLDEEYYRLNAAAEELDKAVRSKLPEAKVEYGFCTYRGEREAMLADNEEELRRALAPRKSPPIIMQAAELMGVKSGLYRDRLEELATELRRRQDEFEKGLDAGGVSAAFAKAAECEERVDLALDEILETFPVTLAGADALRQLAADNAGFRGLGDHAIECYRALALSGKPLPEDQRILLLFRHWIEAAREWSAAPKGAAEKAADERWNALQDEIEASPASGARSLAVKLFIRLREDFSKWAPTPSIRSDDPNPADRRLFRDMARVVPEIAELTAAIIHEDAALIDADMDVLWVAEVSDRAYPGSGPYNDCVWRQEVEETLATALLRIRNTEAKTSRGRAIKQKHGLAA